MGEPGISSGSVVRLPGFSDDNHSVSGYTMPVTDVVARVLVPLPFGDRHISWQDAADSPVDGYTRLSSILERHDQLEAPDGCIDSNTVRRLMKAFVEASGSGVSQMVGISRVYCEDGLLLATPLTVESETLRLIQTAQLDLFRVGNVSVFDAMSAERRRHFPCAVWASDLSWSLATWLYSDSWFFSGSRKAYSAFIATGLEMYMILRDTEMMAEGD
ncbi:MAG: hypothetical protein LBU38_03655 [Propionibacteriaceae bacterium]|nr:hypothetical protein [Propionibacteriaceae bacterium]